MLVPYVLVSSTYVVYILHGYRAKKLETSHFNKLFVIFDVFATRIIVLSTTCLYQVAFLGNVTESTSTMANRF